MKKMCAFLLLALPLTALAYPIDVSKQFNGSEVSATAVEIDHNMVGLLLENYGKADASCVARFANGPESPRVRKATLAGGKRENLTVRFTRSVIHMRIELTCKPQ